MPEATKHKVTIVHFPWQHLRKLIESI